MKSETQWECKHCFVVHTTDPLINEAYVSCDYCGAEFELEECQD